MSSGVCRRRSFSMRNRIPWRQNGRQTVGCLSQSRVNDSSRAVYHRVPLLDTTPPQKLSQGGRKYLDVALPEPWGSGYTHTHENTFLGSMLNFFLPRAICLFRCVVLLWDMKWKESHEKPTIQPSNLSYKHKKMTNPLHVKSHRCLFNLGLFGHLWPISACDP